MSQLKHRRHQNPPRGLALFLCAIALACGPLEQEDELQEDGAALTTGQVRVGSGTFQVVGINVSRSTNQLIVYTPARGANTGTNVWGAEAAVVNGVVISLVDQQSGGGPALAIPAGGVVLSGHGAARTFLLTHAKVGATVQLPGVPTPAPAQSGTVKVGSNSHRLAGTNIERGSDQLILFTPIRGATTGTNQWGAEAAVVNGRVTALVDRQQSGAPALAIPAGGVVLSGHGAARLFLLANAQVGAIVQLPGQISATPATAKSVKIGSGSFNLSGTDVARGTGELILYRPGHGATTGTNQYGVEVAVVNGQVSQVRAWQTGMAIPANGYVLSGHDAAAQFLLAHAVVGATVTLGGQSLSAPPSGSGTGLPARVVAGYWTSWAGPRLRDVPAAYNVVYLFAAGPVGGAPGTTGAVFFQQQVQTHQQLVEDVALLRSQGRKVLLSIGGAGAGLDLSTRVRAEAFVASVRSIYTQLGGFDGIDWNTYEADQAPNATQMIWASLELKRVYGQHFAITTPPAPWRASDRSFCLAMKNAGALDYAAPQYYDGPGLANQAYIVNNVREWINLLGAAHVAVGFGIVPGLPNYQTTSQVVSTWNAIEAEHPEIKGAFLWSVTGDRTNGWGFANQVAPLVSSK